MKYISMFSGIEAASVAFGPLGWEPLAFAEIEPFPSAVLAHHYPDVPNVGDVTAHDWAQYRGQCDLVVAGPPCQAFSVAGLRNSLDDHRGNLSLVHMKAVHAIDPRWTVTENVPGWLSTRDNAFGCYLAGLVGADAPLLPPEYPGRWTDAGVVSGPVRTAAWRVLDAQFFGLAQRRRRVFVLSVRGTGNWAAPTALLPFGESLRGDPPPRREEGERVAYRTAPSLTGSGRGVARTGESRGQDPVIAFDTQQITPAVANPLTARMHKGINTPCDEGQTMVAHTLRGTGHDASEDGTGRGTPLVVDTLVSNGDAHSGFRDEKGLVAYPLDLRNAGRDPEDTRQGSGCNTADGDPSPTLTKAFVPGVAAFGWQNSASQGDSFSEHITPSLDKSKVPAVYEAAMQVRRLSPKECARLQGFPDDYLDILYRGKPAADGPKYKALGNSMAVPVMRWIGERIAMVDGLTKDAP